MLGVYFSVWVLTLLELLSSGSTWCMANIGSTDASAWCTISGYIGSGLVGGMSGSIISITCGSWMSTSTPGISIFSTSMSDASTPGISIWSTLEVSTPGISTSLIGRPCLTVKNNCYGWLLPRALTRVITIYGIVPGPVRFSITKTLESSDHTVLSGAWVRFSSQYPEPYNKGHNFAWAQWKPARRLQMYGAQHRK